MRCNGDVGSGPVDGMVTVGVNSIIATLEEIMTCHLENCLQLEMWW